VHLTTALGALVTGPVALWARRGRTQRPRLHRAFGHAWVTLILATALSALFIRDWTRPNIAGYSPIHVLIPVTLGMLFLSFSHLVRGNITGHRKLMQRLYVSTCIVAGGFTLLPSRYLGHLLWSDWLGLV
ncbi:MAG: putative rane protein, partial [Rhodoferax sp.]|nr:putative rane protein [Rhodoferax sp.]